MLTQLTTMYGKFRPYRSVDFRSCILNRAVATSSCQRLLKDPNRELPNPFHPTPLSIPRHTTRQRHFFTLVVNPPSFSGSKPITCQMKRLPITTVSSVDPNDKHQDSHEPTDRCQHDSLEQSCSWQRGHAREDLRPHEAWIYVHESHLLIL